MKNFILVFLLKKEPREYSTEAKAFAVLNAIQNSIRGRGHRNLDGICDHSLGGVEFHAVFNMPKDEEVDKNEY